MDDSPADGDSEAKRPATHYNDEKSGRQQDYKSGQNLVDEGLKAGQRIAKISIITLVGIGIAEIAIGQIGGSVVAKADGIDSFSDAMISAIVLIGLRIAHRPADRKFHFGYYKVESFAALIAAIGMIAIGVYIMFHSYDALLHPKGIDQPIITMAILAVASVISLHRAFQMNSIAKKYNLLSLRTDAKNSIKDGSASIIGFISVFIATQFGFIQMDAIGGMIIAGYIFSVSYLSLRQSSLILVDSWQNPKLTELIGKTIEDRFSDRVRAVRSVLIRPAGMVAYAEIHIEVDGNERLTDVELLLVDIEMAIRSRFPIIQRISAVPHSYSAKTRSAPPPKRFGVFSGQGAKRNIPSSAADAA